MPTFCQFQRLKSIRILWPAFIGAMFLDPAQMEAQEEAENRFRLGIVSGLEVQTIEMSSIRYFPETLAAWSEDTYIGGVVGISGQKPIWPWLYFQPGINLSFNRNQIRFSPGGPKQFKFREIELPVHFVFTDARKVQQPLRACVLAGFRLGWNTIGANHPELLTLAPERIGVDLGLGAVIKFKRWKIQPSLIYSPGINDIHLFEKAEYDDVVNRVRRHKFGFRLQLWHFKG